MKDPLQNIPEAIIILDTHNQIIGVNPVGEQLFNIKQADLVGKSVDVIFPRQSTTAYRDEILLEGRKEVSLSCNDGKTFYAELKVSVINGLDGKLFGRVLSVCDNANSQESAMRFQQGEVLKKQNAILRALQDITLELHSSLDLDVALKKIVERACKLLGTTHGDLDILRETGELEPVVGVGELEESLKFKVAKGEGLSGTVWKTGKPLVITDYDKWQDRISNFKRGAIRAIVGVPLILKGQVVGVIGVARGTDEDATFSEDDAAMLKRFADLAVVALQNARLFRKAQQEIEFRRKTEIQLRDANQVLKLQIKRVERLQKQLQELAVRDPLTDLYNRRYLKEALELEFAHPERSGKSSAILMMDSDYLKAINDKFGHKAGDDFLIQIADVIKDNIRVGDIACRYGGDEYVVVMSNVNSEIAYKRAESLRRGIARQSIVHRNENVNISVSIGIAMFPEHGSLREVLFQKADQALYEAKRRGKNRVVLYQEGQKQIT